MSNMIAPKPLTPAFADGSFGCSQAPSNEPFVELLLQTQDHINNHDDPHQTRVFVPKSSVCDTAPQSTDDGKKGDMWLDSSDNSLYVYSGEDWVKVSSDSVDIPTYTAGYGITIDDVTISVDDTVVAKKADLASKYEIPEGGIPKGNLAQAVQDILDSPVTAGSGVAVAGREVSVNPGPGLYLSDDSKICATEYSAGEGVRIEETEKEEVVESWVKCVFRTSVYDPDAGFNTPTEPKITFRLKGDVLRRYSLIINNSHVWDGLQEKDIPESDVEVVAEESDQFLIDAGVKAMSLHLEGDGWNVYTSPRDVEHDGVSYVVGKVLLTPGYSDPDGQLIQTKRTIPKNILSVDSAKIQPPMVVGEGLRIANRNGVSSYRIRFSLPSTLFSIPENYMSGSYGTTGFVGIDFGDYAGCPMTDFFPDGLSVTITTNDIASKAGAALYSRFINNTYPGGNSVSNWTLDQENEWKRFAKMFPGVPASLSLNAENMYGRLCFHLRTSELAFPGSVANSLAVANISLAGVDLIYCYDEAEAEAYMESTVRPAFRAYMDANFAIGDKISLDLSKVQKPLVAGNAIAIASDNKTISVKPEDLPFAYSLASGVKPNDRSVTVVPDGEEAGADVAIPREFSDIVLKTTGKVAALRFHPTITSYYGDVLPEEGENVITVTRLSANSVLVKVVPVEPTEYQSDGSTVIEITAGREVAIDTYPGFAKQFTFEFSSVNVPSGVTSTIDWGDGTVTPHTTKTHTYAKEGQYFITLGKEVTNFSLGGGGVPELVDGLVAWGENISAANYTFCWCYNMRYAAKWSPSITSANYTYQSCSQLREAWSTDPAELMPDHIEHHEGCVSGTPISSLFYQSWGGPLPDPA